MYAIVGVVASGNLEVLLERVLDGTACEVNIKTPVEGFEEIWRAVVADFIERYSPGGLKISLNDLGSTGHRFSAAGSGCLPDGGPRVKNSLTESGQGSWYEATARQRVDALLDPGSFKEFVEPTARQISPHLHLFDLPEAFDDGIVVGRGTIKSREILITAQEGRFMGGTFGEVHGGKLVGLLRFAARSRSAPGRSCCFWIPVACACRRPTRGSWPSPRSFVPYSKLGPVAWRSSH